MDHFDEALEILERVRGKPQSLSERKRLAIDLAALMLEEAEKNMTAKEKKLQRQMARLMKDPVGKAFTTAMTDQCFRSSTNRRIADQMIYLLNKFGVPRYLDWIKRTELFIFKVLGPSIAQFLVPLATAALRKETEQVILPGEAALLTKHLKQRNSEGVRQNINHLGEAILSEAEAKNRLHTYLEDLKNPDIDYMSVKISTIFSQINLLSFDDTVDCIADRLRQLYRAAMKTPNHKFVNLDMEEYRDLDLTVAVFQKVLDEPEFFSYSAGIVLQAYLPDSHNYQKQLTEWAKRRVKEGRAPIKIRIVKGANLAMEQFEASVKGWPQAPYTNKLEVDANYKKMVAYGCLVENARAVRLGIASHNLFDVAFALLLRAENQVEAYTGFEMLEGMADHIRRVVQKLAGDMLLYCPVATRQEFQHAIAYLIRRLDENTGAENFLRHVFGLKPGTDAWETQTALFSQSCDEIESVNISPRRKQNRQLYPDKSDIHPLFDNEPDTDFSLPQNRAWIEEVVSLWKDHKPDPIPLVIDGKEVHSSEEGKGYNSYDNVKPLYTYSKAGKKELNEALNCAKSYEKQWSSTTVEHRSQLMARVAQKLRERRGELLGIMMIDGSKTIFEGDPEVSEAIDFAEYYRRQIERMDSLQKDLKWTAKGTVLVASPWNFPCAIPAGGMLAALAMGNCVLFKPASDVVLTGWHLINAFWDAGIPKEALQFIPCSGDEAGSELIGDERVNCVILTGGTETAKKFLKIRPSIDLAAETGGKNSTIVTALADRDLAIKDIIQSAFGHGGQKCSATSLAILEAEVYDDPHFRKSLREAAASLRLGPATDLTTKLAPLIHEPHGSLKRALTTLEEGEEWLLEPRQDPDCPSLWSPGIKMGVRPGSFTHMTELFGPVLGLMRAENLEHAIQIANAVPYGLTTGLQSLDEREQDIWMEKIEAGNLYINRGTTGAIVRRQPFGGCKASSFGGGSKAGGPNYLREFGIPEQIGLPQNRHPLDESVNQLTAALNSIHLSVEQLALWAASCSNYAYWWKKLSQDRDPTKVVGQDNFFRYIPRNNMVLRIGKDSTPIDVLRVCAAALTCGAGLGVSFDPAIHFELKMDELSSFFNLIQETEAEFLERVRDGKMSRIRIVEKGSEALFKAAAIHAIYVVDQPVLANGRMELLHYVREVAISFDYHRYGNLGLREGELRKPIL